MDDEGMVKEGAKGDNNRSSVITTFISDNTDF